MKINFKTIIAVIFISSSVNFSAQNEKVRAVVPPKNETEVSDKSISDNDLYSLAWDEYKKGNYETALKLINKLIKKDDQMPQYYQVKAYILIKMERNKEIIETCTKGIAVNPNIADFYEMRANTYYFEFQPEKALLDYRKMIELETKNARYYNNYLKLLNEMRKDVEMIKTYEILENEEKAGTKFDDAEKFLDDAYFYASLAFERQKNPNKAIELLSKAIKNSPDAEMYYNNRGLIYSDLDEDQKALKDMNKAIELTPDNDDFFVNRSRVYFRMNDHINGRKDLLKALALGNSDPGVYADIAITYLIENNHQKASEYYKIAAEKMPHKAGIVSNYAYSLLELKDIKGAKTNFEKAYKVEPTEIDILLGLMMVSYLKNDGNLQKYKSTFEKDFSERKLNASLLNSLEKEGYSYSDTFKKNWVELLKKL